jgi:hypothetical protein
VLGLELFELGEAGLVVSLVGKFGGKCSAELNGFGEKGVGAELHGGGVFGFIWVGLGKLLEEMLRFAVEHSCEVKLISRQGESGGSTALAPHRFGEKSVGASG